MINRKPYSTDIFNQQWTILEPLIPSPKASCRSRTVNMSGINQCYLLDTYLRPCCAWRLMPHDLPPRSTVYYYFRAWRIQGSWPKINQILREKVAIQVKFRKKTPFAAIIDSQSVKTTKIATEVGYDGDKLVKGHKRRILVDTLGLLLAVIVTAANIAEKKGAIQLLEKISTKFPRLEKIFADKGYQGQNLQRPVQNDYNLDLEVVKRTQSKGFNVIPWRWIVERTFA